MPFGEVSMNEVGDAASVLIHEGAAVDHEHVLAPVDENTYRHALALPQARGLVADEAQAGGHLAGDYLGRYPIHHGFEVPPAALEICAHARPQIAREALDHLDLHFECGQIDHREERRILGNAGT